MRSSPIAVACAGACGLAAQAQTVIIDFENLPAMSNSPGSFVPVDARLHDQFLASHGLRLSSGTPYCAAVLLGSGRATSGVLGLGGTLPTGQLSYANLFPVVGEFFVPGDPNQPAITDSVSVRLDLLAVPAATTLRVYGLAGDLLGSVSSNNAGGTTLALSATGIHRFEIAGNGTNGFDDLTFALPVTPGGGCPADLDDGSGTGTPDGGVDINDLLFFLAKYEAGDVAADLDDGSGTGTHDGGVDINDLLFFLTHYEAGC